MAGNGRPGPRRPGLLAGALILTAAFEFGGLDQYIGSLFSNFATTVSGMSAPWLLLPFAAGAAQAARPGTTRAATAGPGDVLLRVPWYRPAWARAGWARAGWVRAAWFGLAATWLAVLGYVLMIDSPVESVHPTLRLVAATAHSQWPWFAGGLISGPLYGVLGWCWRSRRSWLSAVLAAVPVLFEPAMNHFGFRPAIDATASFAEAAAGLALAGYFGYVLVRARRAPAAGP